MNKQDEKSKSKSVVNIRQGKRARTEKEKQEKEQQITNSAEQRTEMSKNQPGFSRLFLKCI